MENITLNELRLFVSEDKLSDMHDKIEYKNYVPYLVKRNLIEQTIFLAIDIDIDNLYTVDYLGFERYIGDSLLVGYTNIEIGTLQLEERIELFDICSQYGIFDKIKECGDAKQLIKLIKLELYQKIKQNNTLENIISTFLTNLNKKIPDAETLTKATKDMAKTIAKVDLNKLTSINKVKELFETGSGSNGTT